MARIFVSYRRKDSAGHAGRLFDRLRDQFGADRVFRDVDRLKGGDDFVEALARAVDACDVFILVIGRDWLEARNEKGHRRLDDPDDFIRLEVETALRRKVLLLPVLVEGAAMPEAGDLPEPLRPLARRQAVELSEHRWDFDIQELVRRIEEVGGRTRIGWRRVALWAAAGAVVLTAGYTSRSWWPQRAAEAPRPSNISTPSTPSSSVQPPAPSSAIQSLPAPPPSGPPPAAVEPPPPKSTVQQASAKSTVELPSVKSTVEPSPVKVESPNTSGAAPAAPGVPTTTPAAEPAVPKPAVSPPPETRVRVPDLSGQSARGAFQAIRDLGLRAKVEFHSTNRAVPDTIYAQRPSAGSLVDRGGVVALYAAAALKPNEYATGTAFLQPGRTIDLDGDDRDRSDWDVSFDRMDDRFFLSFGSRTRAGFLPLAPGAPTSFDPTACERVEASLSRLLMTEGMSGRQVCVRTNAGRTAAIFLGRFTPDPPELFIRYSTLSTLRSEPKPPPVKPVPPPVVVRCEQAVQGRIAWDYSGTTAWNPANVERLCRDAADDQPARCFDRVMHGGINWGGGTRWEWQNAISLCEGTTNATATIACFQQSVGQGRPWAAAISACRQWRLRK